MSDQAKGIGLLLVTVFVFSASDAMGKVIAESEGGLMVSWSRFVFALVALPLAFPHRIGTMVRTKNPRLQVWRSIVVIGANTLFFVGLRYLPLADAVAIGFVAPFLTTVLAIPILGEKVGIRRWTAIVVGFVGMLIIVRPGFEDRHWAYVLPVVSAAFWAIYVVLTRKLGSSDTSLTTLFYTPVAGAIALTAAAPLYWTWPTPGHWVILVMIGVLATIGHLALIRAYHLAPASLLAPFTYFSIVFATVLGFLVFDALPDKWTLVGAVIVVASGVYVFHRETRVRRRADA
ncbi:MAG: DMT family transporter [Alphaproteobacteria bacterium]